MFLAFSAVFPATTTVAKNPSGLPVFSMAAKLAGRRPGRCHWLGGLLRLRFWLGDFRSMQQLYERS
jgi:hypothetical protein